MTHPIAEASEESPFGALTAQEFYSRHSVSHGSEYVTNPRGLKLFTQWWTPLPPAEVVGILAIVHGFTGRDQLGHGFSEGLVAHIPDISPVVDDCISFFESFRARHAPSLPSFLYAESLGGAIAIFITLRRVGKPWDGLILNGAMVGISAKFKPPWPLEHLLFLVAAPEEADCQATRCHALELLRVCKELQGKFEEVEVPLLIVHGGDDVVCDPACAEELYKRASSKDKTLRIHPGMWHQLIGEPPENVELVFGQMVDWLRTRAERAPRASDNGGA
ncbi:hypothetical protein M0R45_037064 [Rubus argutus]|uniref:Serine aminopeptidase S33 domain-containing protein n=1 Tax=Rubus argutus TaxID=59490 RepID=A0AAW1W1A6_RUBAR